MECCCDDDGGGGGDDDDDDDDSEDSTQPLLSLQEETECPAIVAKSPPRFPLLLKVASAVEVDDNISFDIRVVGDGDVDVVSRDSHSAY